MTFITLPMCSPWLASPPSLLFLPFFTVCKLKNRPPAALPSTLYRFRDSPSSSSSSSPYFSPSDDPRASQLITPSEPMEPESSSQAAAEAAYRHIIERLAFLETQAEAQANQLQAQAAEIAALQSASANTTSPASTEPKIADPEPFGGERAALHNFLSKCRLKFAGQPSRFNKEEKKIFYAGALLKGVAYSWFQPLLTRLQEGNPVPEFATFQTFADALTRMYGDPNLEATSERLLNKLKQTGSAAWYLAEFQRLSQYIRWNDSALYNRFYEGLTDDIKDEIAKYGRPKTLVDLQNFATSLDGRMYDRYLEKRDAASSVPAPTRRLPTATAVRNPTFFRPTTNMQYPNTAPAYTPPKPRPFNQMPARFPPSPAVKPPTASTAPASDGSTPMELDMATGAWKLTTAEKARRKQLNLCPYCGGSGHNVFNCPNRPSRDPRSATYANVSLESSNPHALIDFDAPVADPDLAKDRSEE